MGSGGVAIAALPTVICLKVLFSDGLGGVCSVKLHLRAYKNLYFTIMKVKVSPFCLILSLMLLFSCSD